MTLLNTVVVDIRTHIRISALNKFFFLSRRLFLSLYHPLLANFCLPFVDSHFSYFEQDSKDTNTI